MLNRIQPTLNKFSSSFAAFWKKAMFYKPGFLWFESVTQTAAYLAPKRELFAFGVSIGQVFIGFMVNLKRPTE